MTIKQVPVDKKINHMQVCKKCASGNILLVEYPPGMTERYDGISEIRCQDCDVRIGRWSGKELAEGELEKRWEVK